MKVSPLLILASLLALAFALATGLAMQAGEKSAAAPTANSYARMFGDERKASDNVFSMMFGDGRKLFANQFFTMADVYFHSGYYPSIFDRAGKESEITATSHGHGDTPDEEVKEDFFGKPRDWIDAFGRNFRIVQHTHLEHHNEREILPWLRLAADLDPQKVETYTVGAYFLWEHLARTNEAEAFLREGLRNNPDDSEILFALGRLYYEGVRDTDHARNVWELGVRKFFLLAPAAQKDNKIVLDELTVNLANLEDKAGNFGAAINWLHLAQTVSPDPTGLQRQIDDLQKKLAALVSPVPGKLY